jgi:5-methylcytosine-specific restriction endonuclease McrA
MSVVELQKSLGVSVKEIGCSLLRAAPHQWGAGRVHLLDTEKTDRTYCGKTASECGGTQFIGRRDQITCKLCLAAIETRVRRAELEKRLQQQNRQREENNRVWWHNYSTYLRSQTWYKKRENVFHRAGGYCEGCREASPVQVHHLKYPRDCMPGSSEWVRKEKLFDLVALCEDCHQDVHEWTR